MATLTAAGAKRSCKKISEPITADAECRACLARRAIIQTRKSRFERRASSKRGKSGRAQRFPSRFRTRPDAPPPQESLATDIASLASPSSRKPPTALATSVQAAARAAAAADEKTTSTKAPGSRQTLIRIKLSKNTLSNIQQSRATQPKNGITPTPTTPAALTKANETSLRRAAETRPGGEAT